MFCQSLTVLLKRIKRVDVRSSLPQEIHLYKSYPAVESDSKSQERHLS